MVKCKVYKVYVYDKVYKVFDKVYKVYDKVYNVYKVYKIKCSVG